MNRKGFTLMELLMVIVIIALLSLVLIPNVVVLKKKNEEKACNSVKDNIISAAKSYVANNKYDLDFDCDSNGTKIVSLNDLIANGYLPNNITNPVQDSPINFDSNVTIKYDCSTKSFDYSYHLRCKECEYSSESECENNYSDSYNICTCSIQDGCWEKKSCVRCDFSNKYSCERSNSVSNHKTCTCSIQNGCWKVESCSCVFQTKDECASHWSRYYHKNTCGCSKLKGCWTYAYCY